jgi:hypothetical protein
VFTSGRVPPPAIVSDCSRFRSPDDPCRGLLPFRRRCPAGRCHRTCHRTCHPCRPKIHRGSAIHRSGHPGRDRSRRTHPPRGSMDRCVPAPTSRAIRNVHWIPESCFHPPGPATHGRRPWSPNVTHRAMRRSRPLHGSGARSRSPGLCSDPPYRYPPDEMASHAPRSLGVARRWACGRSQRVCHVQSMASFGRLGSSRR